MPKFIANTTPINANGPEGLPYPTTGFGERPMLIEAVSESGMMDRLAPTLDIYEGLAEICEPHQLRLSDNSPDLGDRPDGFRFRKDSPDLFDRLRNLFTETKPRIVHTRRPEELATVGRAARAAGVPNLLHSLCGNIAGASEADLAKFTEIARELKPLIIAPHREILDKLNIDLPVEILPTGIDCEHFVPGDMDIARRKVGLPTGPKIIGCGTPAQHLEQLFKSLFRMNRDVHVALFGAASPGPIERAQIRRLGLEERVHILGNWAKPVHIFQAIDAYFHGPANDCLPCDVLVAQACGKPVTACMPTPTDFLCPQTARLAPANYIPTLRSTLTFSVSSSEAEVTRRFVLDNWDIARTFGDYARLLVRLADSTESGSRPV